MKPNEKSPHGFHPWALLLISIGSLGVEISLVRYFSYVFVDSYVYILISLTVAGIGAGAVIVYFVNARARATFARLLWAVPLIVLVALIVIDLHQGGIVVSLILMLMVFAAVGAYSALVFRDSGYRVSYLYAADLIGAAAGTALSFFALNLFGAVGALLTFGLVIGAGFILAYWGFFGFKKSAVFVLVALTSIVIVGFNTHLGRHLLPHAALGKSMTLMLKNKQYKPRIVESRWNAFGRVDLVQSDNPLFKVLFEDGAAGTKMINMKGGKIDPTLASDLKYLYMGGVPMLAMPKRERQNAVIVGSGGGIDVDTLLLWGFKSITAVEINPGFVRMVKHWGTYNGNIYNDHPHVHLVLGEGRSYIRQSRKKYSLILMSLPVTESARNYGAQALVENYLFTTQAISEYRHALKKNGFLVVVTHYRYELMRLVVNILKSYREDGIPVATAMRSIACIGTDRTPTLVLKNGQFTPTQIGTYEGVLRTLHLRGRSNFLPFLPQQSLTVKNPQTGQTKQVPEFDPGLYYLSRGAISLNTLIAASPENISWVTDDRPFFYQMTKGLPTEDRIVFILGAALLVALGIGFALRRDRRPVTRRSIPWRYFASFSLLGFGYMLVEIATLQKFIMFWDDQTLALSVTLSAILFFSGLGSFVSRRISSPAQIVAAIAGVAAICTASAWYLSGLPMLQTGRPVVKAAVTLGAIAPVFFLMGMPFPYLLRRLSDSESLRTLYPWMMGVNSLATLFAAGAAMSLAVIWGYHYALLLGALSYAGVLALVVGLHGRSHESTVQPPSSVEAYETFSEPSR